MCLFCSCHDKTYVFLGIHVYIFRKDCFTTMRLTVMVDFMGSFRKPSQKSLSNIFTYFACIFSER